MQDTTLHPGSTVTQTLPIDLICVRCRYALKGSAASSLCPECGLPVAESLARPGLVNAPVATLRRLRSSLFWLSLSAGLLLGLAIALIIVTMRILMVFMVSSPSPLDEALLKGLPLAMTAGLVTAGVTATRSTMLLQSAGACHKSAPTFVGGSFTILIVVWGYACLAELFSANVIPTQALGFASWISGCTTAMSWSELQRRAVWIVGGGIRRSIAVLQLVAACLIALAGGVILIGPLIHLPFRPGTADIYYYSQNSLVYILLALFLLFCVNALSLRIALGRVMKARAVAA